jgi:hypothetical protein
MIEIAVSDIRNQTTISFRNVNTIKQSGMLACLYRLVRPKRATLNYELMKESSF